MESNNINRVEVPPRVVLVILQEFEADSWPLEFEVDLSLLEMVDRKTDFDSIVHHIILNQPSMSETYKSATFQWKLAGKHFPDHFVDAEYEARGFPVLQHLSLVKCFFKRNVAGVTHSSNVRDETPMSASCSTTGGQSENCDMDTLIIDEEDHHHSVARTAKPSTNNKKQIRRSINMRQFSLPTFFNAAINKKLKENKGLNYNEQSFVCRTIVHHVLPFCHQPDTKCISEIVRLLLTKYRNSLVPDEYDFSTVQGFYVNKMQLVFGRERRKGGFQLSTKGGRPRKEKKIDSNNPGTREKEIATPDDMVSYYANVKKMLELYKTSNRSAGLRELWQLTFLGRKFEIEKYMPTIEEVLKNKCPMLDQPSYLLGELDFILGPNTCKKFRDNWIINVPKILEVAKITTSKNVKTLYGQLEKNLDDDFDAKSCAALQLLPVLVPGPMRDSAKSISYFFDVHEDSANLADVIRRPVRSSPFILKIGTGYHIIAEGQPFVFLTNSSMEAFLCLIATYYVMGMVFEKQVLPSLLFVQSELLGLPDTSTRGCRVLCTLLRLLCDVRCDGNDSE